MPEQLSIKDFAAKIRERRPDLASVSDDLLVGKTLESAPQLKQFVNLDTTVPAPEGILSQLFGHLGVQKHDPGIATMGNPSMLMGNVPSLTQPSVASEGAAQSLVGMGQALKAAPGAAMDAAGVMTDPMKMLSFILSAHPCFRPGRIKPVISHPC